MKNIRREVDVVRDYLNQYTAGIVCNFIHGQPQKFDCFVCFNYNKFDHDFVKEMSCTLENKPYNLVMFIPGRDDLPGGSRYTMDAKLIKHRCRRLVVIVSRNFHNSAACDFHVKFCHALSPGARSKKIVPVLIEPDVLVPDILNHVGLCDYTKEDMRDWFWDRLSNAIKAPLHPEEC
ncbi:hypothetical protein FSP39_009543 [Pinctada imbricata]|uniref:TIR domain-containing protein n=1 Tax=Pinctada imbricata TaxID=66713 RepID=A0AA88YI54_PINIB|nr:hypothetical protein FSP39_009543 [Pinctada imbricata]